MEVKILKTGSFGALTNVTNEVLAAANGVLTSFTGTLDNIAASPGTLSITATIGAAPVTITDTTYGTLAGTGVTGTINYYSGAFTLNFTTAPDNATNITANYSYAAVGPFQVTDYNTSVTISAGVTKYRGQLPERKIQPGSVTFKVKFDTVTETYTDNAYGKLQGDNLASGYINYDDGTFLLVFYFVPDTTPSQTLLATYKHRNVTANEHLLKFQSENFNRATVFNDTGGLVKLLFLESIDGYTWSQALLGDVANGTAEVFPIGGSSFVRLVSFNNSGFYVELFNQ